MSQQNRNQRLFQNPAKTHTGLRNVQRNPNLDYSPVNRVQWNYNYTLHTFFTTAKEKLKNHLHILCKFSRMHGSTLLDCRCTCYCQQKYILKWCKFVTHLTLYFTFFGAVTHNSLQYRRLHHRIINLNFYKVTSLTIRRNCVSTNICTYSALLLNMKHAGTSFLTTTYSVFSCSKID